MINILSVNPMTVSKESIKNVNLIYSIHATKGKFCKVTYRKKDGTLSTYTVRTGVKKYVTGAGKHHPPDSVTVYSVTKGNEGYKTFLLGGIQEVKCGKITYR